MSKIIMSLKDYNRAVAEQSVNKELYTDYLEKLEAIKKREAYAKASASAAQLAAGLADAKAEHDFVEMRNRALKAAFPDGRTG